MLCCSNDPDINFSSHNQSIELVDDTVHGRES